MATTPLSQAAIGLAALVLLGVTPAHGAAKPHTAASCERVANAIVPPDYLVYHALVAPSPVVPSGQPGRGSVHAACTPKMVIRT